MEIINESVAPTTRFDSIKWGECFILEKGVYIRTKGADSATRLSDGNVCEFPGERLVRKVDAKVVIT